MKKQMDLEVVRLRRFEDEDSKLKAFVDVAVGEFIVKGLRSFRARRDCFWGCLESKARMGAGTTASIQKVQRHSRL
jgi:DNA-binding cell septation regulator SpoVG